VLDEPQLGAALRLAEIRAESSSVLPHLPSPPDAYPLLHKSGLLEEQTEHLTADAIALLRAVAQPVRVLFIQVNAAGDREWHEVSFTQAEPNGPFRLSGGSAYSVVPSPLWLHPGTGPHQPAFR
jgi:hypothetical protein